jgi:hypothetical protein
LSSSHESDWKGTLLTLSDDSFFELMRNYLGELSTPFNKHDLIGRLDAFLRREDVQSAILALIDDEDQRLLTAISVLGEPPVEELFDFFEQELSYLDLHYLLMNLEDRLLVYRNTQSDRIEFVPAVAELLRANIIAPEALFPSEKSEPPTPESCVNDPALAAVISYLLDHPNILKMDGSLKKRAREEISKLFGGEVELFISALKALRCVGVLVGEADELRLLPRRMRELARLPRSARLALVWGAEAFEDARSGETIVDMTHRAMSVLEEGRAYSPAVVARLVQIGEGPDVRRRSVDMAEWLSGMRARKVLIEVGEELLAVNPRARELVETPAKNDQLTIEANFDMTLGPEAGLSSGIIAATLGHIRRFDIVSHFELAKTALARSLRAGVDLEELLEAVGPKLPQNVAMSLETWKTEYSSIELHEGVVLVVREDRRLVIEHDPEISSILDRTLAPGVYLVAKERLSALEEALARSGVEMLPHLESPISDARRAPELPRELGQPSLFSASDEIPGSLGAAERPGSSRKRRKELLVDGEAIGEALREQLETMDAAEDKREEIAVRIARKLIVVPEQINPRIVRAEKAEARGLDYVGKVRLIEQSLRAGGFFLEVFVRGANGEPQRTVLKPTRLDRRGSNLWLLGTEIPGDRELEVNVSKISLVRRLRGTLLTR